MSHKCSYSVKSFLQIQKLWSSDLNYIYAWLIFLERYHSENFQVTNFKKFSYMLRHCQINEWLLGLISLGNFYFCMIITSEFQKTSLFSSFTYGLVRIDNWERMASFVGRKLHNRAGSSEAEMLPWIFKTVLVFVRNFFLIIQKLQICQNWVQEIAGKLSQTKETCYQISRVCLVFETTWAVKRLCWSLSLR